MENYRLAVFYCIIVNPGAEQGSDAGSVGIYTTIQAPRNWGNLMLFNGY